VTGTCASGDDDAGRSSLVGLTGRVVEDDGAPDVVAELSVPTGTLVSRANGSELVDEPQPANNNPVTPQPTAMRLKAAEEPADNLVMSATMASVPR